jgi:hypothetical protein
MWHITASTIDLVTGRLLSLGRSGTGDGVEQRDVWRVLRADFDVPRDQL